MLIQYLAVDALCVVGSAFGTVYVVVVVVKKNCAWVRIVGLIIIFLVLFERISTNPTSHDITCQTFLPYGKVVQSVQPLRQDSGSLSDVLCQTSVCILAIQQGHVHPLQLVVCTMDTTKH